MIRISNIKIAAQKEQKKILEQEICRLLRIKSLQQLEYHIVKKSIHRTAVYSLSTSHESKSWFAGFLDLCTAL